MKYFKKKRLEKELTQEKVADYCGVDRSTVSKWEKGTSFPRIDKVKKLAALFGCTVGEIMENWKEETEEDEKAPAGAEARNI